MVRGSINKTQLHNLIHSIIESIQEGILADLTQNDCADVTQKDAGYVLEVFSERLRLFLRNVCER